MAAWLEVAFVVVVAACTILMLLGFFFHVRAYLRRLSPSQEPLREWKKTAQELPWRDRWEIYFAHLRRRAVRKPYLAPYAIQRAEAFISSVELAMPAIASTTFASRRMTLRNKDRAIRLLRRSIEANRRLLDGG